jgi:hypothetical protein
MGKSDRFTKILLCLLVVGVWGLLMAPLFRMQPVEAQGRTSSVKWEYNISDDGTVGNWNKYGNQGWEAVGYIGGGQMIFKRRR